MAFCILPANVEKFKKAITDGTINPDKLNSMTSEARRNFLAEFVGEDKALDTNILFESKLLLKNQKQGLINWAKAVMKDTPVAYRKDIFDRINSLDKALSPEEGKMFLGDLVEKKLGVGLTADEGKLLMELSNNVKKAEALATDTAEQSLSKGYTMSDANLNFGREQAKLTLYMSKLQSTTGKFDWSDFKHWNTLSRIPGNVVHQIADLTKAIKASYDMSFIGRQGRATLLSNPRLWKKEALKQFKTVYDTLKNPEAARVEFLANIMGDPMYKQAIKDGVALGKRDDFFVSAIPAKLGSHKVGNLVIDKPLLPLGRAYSASELAYDSMAQNLRLGLYKKYMAKASKLENVSPDFGKNYATLVNSMTGRGYLGKTVEPASGLLNLGFYSARFMKSQLDQLILHPLGMGVGGLGSAAQKAAALNLGRSVAATGGLMLLANALAPGSMETDPRSSDFGKIKIGNMRFDVTGGQASYIVFLAKLFSGKSKSTTTGIVSEPGRDKLSLNFLRSKLSPIAGNLWDLFKGEYYSGEKTSLRGELEELAMPIGLSNLITNLKNSSIQDAFLQGFAEFFGVGSNSYTPSGGDKEKSSWTDTTAADKLAFKAKVGEEKFQEAGKKFDALYDEWMAKTIKTPEYINASDKNKKSVVNTKINELKNQIYKEYNYKYTEPKKSKEDKADSALVKAILNATK